MSNVEGKIKSFSLLHNKGISLVVKKEGQIEFIKKG